MGAVVLQAKDIAAGRTPRDMDNPQFVRDAILQGGGFGLVGDVLLKDQNRFGGGLVQSMVGPKVGLVEDIGRLTFGNVQEALEGKDTKLAGEAVDFLNRYTPTFGRLN